MIRLGKKLSFYTFLAAVLMFGGCSQKSVEMDAGEEVSQEVTTTKEDTTQKDTSESRLDRLDKEDASSDTMSAATDGQEERTAAMSKYAGKYANTSDFGVQTLYFPFDKFFLTDEMREIAKDNANILTSNDDTIKLEGNCDEWGTDEYNYALGLKRAKTVKDALITDGIASSRIIMVSFGESNPVCNEHNRNCWKLNRRVDYKKLP